MNSEIFDLIRAKLELAQYFIILTSEPVDSDSWKLTITEPLMREGFLKVTARVENDKIISLYLNGLVNNENVELVHEKLETVANLMMDEPKIQQGITDVSQNDYKYLWLVAKA